MDNGNNVTGADSQTLTVPADSYTIVETGTLSGSAFTETVTGTDNVTQTQTGNSLAGNFTQTVTGTGTYSRTETGGTLGSGSGTLGYTQTESASPLAGRLNATLTGTDRYGLLQQFADVSDTRSGSAPGHMNFSPFGTAFVDPGEKEAQRKVLEDLRKQLDGQIATLILNAQFSLTKTPVPPTDLKSYKAIQELYIKFLYQSALLQRKDTIAKTPDRVVEAIDSRIKSLGDDDFDTRQAASKALKDYVDNKSPYAFVALTIATMSSDAEVARRAKELLDKMPDVEKVRVKLLQAALIEMDKKRFEAQQKAYKAYQAQYKENPYPPELVGLFD